MKITEVRTILTGPHLSYVLVKIMTDVDGLYGVGDGTLAGNEEAVAKTVEHLGELLIGRDPAAIEDCWQQLYHSGYWRGGPVFMSALGALDLALWDIKGKVAGQPIYQLLGGQSREGVSCYGHAHGRDAVEVEDNVRRFQAQGYQYIRAQLISSTGYGGYGGQGMVRFEPSTHPHIPGTSYFSAPPYLNSTPKLFEHLRATIGWEVNLLHDVHEQLTPIEAAWLAKQLEPYRLFYLEDPLRPEQREHFKLLREASTTALAIGELFNSRWDCLSLMQNHWIDFIRIAPIHVGGITEARKICILAETFQVQTAFHGAQDIGPIGQAAAVHIDMAIPNFGVQEWITFPDAVHEVMPGACELREGKAYPNDRPGLGIDINEEAARKYPFKKKYMPIIRRADGTMHVY